MGAGLFWGIILIVIGLSIIFRVLFDISVFRIVIAVVFILIGIRMLVGRPVVHTEENENNVIFGEKNYKFNPVHGTEYNTVFGRTIYDFRDARSLDELHTRVTFNTVFGSTDILLPPDIAVKIKTEAVFSSARMPNGNTVAFGSTKYTSPNAADSAMLLDIEAHVVFGGLSIKQ